jgi:uncharacterized lipoprotein YajG
MHGVKLAIVALSLAFAACAPTRQVINFQPQVPAAGATPSTSASLTLSVRDERGDPRLGKRAEVVLLTEQDLTELLRSTLQQALQERGYAVETTASSRSLVVAIRALEMNAAGGKWQAKAELASIGKNGSSDYKASYRVEREKTGILNPGPKETEDTLNELLNESVAKLLADGDLLDFLAK